MKGDEGVDHYVNLAMQYTHIFSGVNFENWKKNDIFNIYTQNIDYVPPPKGWGTYCFWCGSRRRRRRRRRRWRSFLSARYLLNHWMDLDQSGTETSLGQPNGVIRFR